MGTEPEVLAYPQKFPGSYLRLSGAQSPVRRTLFSQTNPQKKRHPAGYRFYSLNVLRRQLVGSYRANLACHDPYTIQHIGNTVFGFAPVVGDVLVDEDNQREFPFPVVNLPNAHPDHMRLAHELVSMF